MKTIDEIKSHTIQLVDDLKATCATYGLGGDGNEYKIITYMFLYKFLNDKFGYDIKQIPKKEYASRIKSAESWEAELRKFTKDEFEDCLSYLDPDTPKLKPSHFLSNIWNQSAKGDFSTLLDNTLVDIAKYNEEIFSMKTESETRLSLFEKITIYVPDAEKRDAFARALISRLTNFSFEDVFARNEGYDFFSVIFEYLIKDYNKDGGGKYAEYYTPHAVASIMARLLVKSGEQVCDVTCYDPSAGTGTLLMAIAHAIGEDRCEIYSQDISQKSSKMLLLNLILNNLVHSIPNVIQGDTLVSPYHRDEGTKALKKFDYIVSNPPFKLDFSDTRTKIADDTTRFFAGVPKVPNKKKESMAIYLCFLQHIIYSLSDKGKACVVVPTGFLTAQSGIEFSIREHLVEKKMLAGVISMPSNIFATTGTNVSVLFFDKSHGEKPVILIDASKLGEKIKEDGNQKTKLKGSEIDKIVTAFHKHTAEDGFSVEVTPEQLKEKNYSFSAGQYFDIKIEYVEITEDEFQQKLADFQSALADLSKQGTDLDAKIAEQLKKLRFNS